jgi:two-component system, NarL family, invasion response regulator UvrY
MSVLIIDDHPFVLQACRRILHDSGFGEVLDARDIASGYRIYRRFRPEVVILDLSMQGNGLAGLPLIKRIRSRDPHTRILVFSMHSDPAIAARALEAGANGYVLKDSAPEELISAFKTVRSGQPYLSGDLAVEVAIAASRMTSGARRNRLTDLAPREFEILSLLACGKTYGQIGEELGVSYKTVVNVSCQLRQKLGARRLADLVRTAVQLLSTTPA